MNGIHDMGGMHGFGPVIREEHEPVFHAAWEAQVRSMMSLTIARGAYNLDEFRYGIEQMPPADYLEATYYERWLASVEYNLIRAGVLDAGEVDARLAAGQQATPAKPTDWRPAPPDDTPWPPITPRFTPGDRIVTRNTHPHGHTRLPRYARGKPGVIHLVHGPEVLADTSAHGLGLDPQVVYNVRFDARELWGEDAEPSQSVHIDLWESYLEPASE